MPTSQDTETQHQVCPSPSRRRSWNWPWPWLGLLAAVAWSVLLRVPLVLCAECFMDSDLAVDGLTLRDALEGRWRWHYPGTPHIGAPPVLLSWVQARIWGATPPTLVSGGVVAHLLVLVSVFLLARRVCGTGAALAGLVPLTFASTGMLWLSAQITGGHLLVVAWSALAWILLERVLRGGRLAWPALGAWCGLGLFVDFMFLMTLGGLVVASCLAWVQSRWRKPRAAGAETSRPTSLRLAFTRGSLVVLAFLAGLSPRWVGQRLDPYDAYAQQFAYSLDSRLLSEHGRILVQECLPRLLWGHRLPSLAADPNPALLGSGAPSRREDHARETLRWEAMPITLLTAGLLLAATAALIGFASRPGDAIRRCIAGGILAASLAVLASFLANRNIFNSDNQRYLVLLLIPWSIGFGRLIARLAALRPLGQWAAGALVVLFAVLFTRDAAAWYRQFGWIDGRGVPVRRRLDDPALRWLVEHPEVTSILGSYWDVYRYSFLTGGAVKGIPYPTFPNRFPEWSAGMPAGRPEILVARRGPDGQYFLGAALREGGKVLARAGGVVIVDWPWPARRRDERGTSGAGEQ